MSYLPRMSKTYKEPQMLPDLDEHNEMKAVGSIQPASSLANEKTYNPQIALKHYKYYPHPPPVLPGPSVVDEANENELHREASKLRRSLSKIDEFSSSELQMPSLKDEQVGQQVSFADFKVVVPEQQQSVEEYNRPGSKRSLVNKDSKPSIGKKKQSGSHLDRKKETSSKQTVNICLVQTQVPDSFVAPQTEQQQTTTTTTAGPRDLSRLAANAVTAGQCSNPFRRCKDPGKTWEEDEASKEFVHRSVQCTIFGSQDKTFVIPPPVNTLLKTLAFVLHEISKDEHLNCTSLEGKRIMTQVQLILGDLCNQTVDRDFGFDVTYSDSKRVEKLLDELQRYVENIYGARGQLSDKEALKKIYLQLRMKELELTILTEKIQERDSLRMTDVEMKGSDMRNPEVTLQNKKLESEQLLAEIEFSGIELRKYQKALAEADWDIKIGNDQMTTMKRSSGSKSRTDILGRKPSVQKFPFDVHGKGTSKGKDQEDGRTRKKT